MIVGKISQQETHKEEFKVSYSIIALQNVLKISIIFINYLSIYSSMDKYFSLFAISLYVNKEL